MCVLQQLLHMPAATCACRYMCVLSRWFRKGKNTDNYSHTAFEAVEGGVGEITQALLLHCFEAVDAGVGEIPKHCCFTALKLSRVGWE